MTPEEAQIRRTPMPPREGALSVEEFLALDRPEGDRVVEIGD